MSWKSTFYLNNISTPLTEKYAGWHQERAKSNPCMLPNGVSIYLRIRRPGLRDHRFISVARVSRGIEGTNWAELNGNALHLKTQRNSCYEAYLCSVCQTQVREFTSCEFKKFSSDARLLETFIHLASVGMLAVEFPWWLASNAWRAF